MVVRAKARAAILGAALIVSPAPAAAQGDARLTSEVAVRPAAVSTLPPSTLRVLDGGKWVEWWSSRQAPVRWSDERAFLAGLARWERVAAGVDLAEMAIGGDEAFRTRVIIARLDPAVVRLALDTGFTGRLRPAWTIGHAPDDAIFAVNAGQFVRALPWGWVVLDGEQFLAPGPGPLSTAITIDSAGRVAWSHGNAGPAGGRRRVAWAFQSYPTLLVDGAVPLPLHAAGQGVDAGHRDARLAIGRLADGRLVVAMTRFDALGPMLGAVPLGLTTPEMAAVMGALGARDAVMLDGGISAQMMLRDEAGKVRSWRGLRPVPLALIARPAAGPATRP